MTELQIARWHLKYSSMHYYELIASRNVALKQFQSNPHNDTKVTMRLTIIALYVHAHCKVCYNRLSVCTQCGETKCIFCKNHQHYR